MGESETDRLEEEVRNGCEDTSRPSLHTGQRRGCRLGLPCVKHRQHRHAKEAEHCHKPRGEPDRHPVRESCDGCRSGEWHRERGKTAPAVSDREEDGGRDEAETKTETVTGGLRPDCKEYAVELLNR